MKAVILRPLCLFTITFFVLSCILFTADTALRLWSAVIFVFLFALSFILRIFIPSLREGTKASAVSLAVLFLLAGAALASALFHYIMDGRPSEFSYLDGETVRFEGAVTECLWDSGFAAEYAVKITGRNGRGDILCALEGDCGIGENSRIVAVARFASVKSITDPSERRYYLSNGIFFTAKAEEITVTEVNDSFSLRKEAQKLRSVLSGVYIKYLGEEEGGFASALMLGENSLLDPVVERDFRRLGISHVLAISGMHLTVICAAASLLLSSLGKNMNRIGCVLIVVFYMFLTGLSPSVTRSGFMLLVLILGELLRQSSDSFTNLGIAAFLICIFDPFAAADIGLQLSFAAVFAILLYVSKKRSVLEKEADKKKSFIAKCLAAILEATLLTVIISLFMLPLQWLYFKEISLVSPLTSPLFSFLSTPLLWSLPFVLLLSPASSLCSLISAVIRPLISLIISLSGEISKLRYISFSLNYPFAFIFCFIIFIAVIAFCVTKKKARLAVGATILSLVIAFGSCCFVYKLPDFDRATVIMLESKTSDGILLSSDSRTMLIDVGNGFTGVFREGIGSLPRLQSTEIEAVMLTHLHSSHPHSLYALFSGCMVRKLILPLEESEVFEEVLSVCELRGVEYMTYTPGDTVYFEDCTVKTYDSVFIKRSTQPIVRLDIKAFNNTFTYLGGAYNESVENASLAECDHVWFGTHGPLYKKSFSPILSESTDVYLSEAAGKYYKGNKKAQDTDRIILD